MEPQQNTTTATATANAKYPLENRVAIITGASRGIGKQIAIHLSSLGANVVLNYCSPSSDPLAEALATQLNTARATTEITRATVSDTRADVVTPRAAVAVAYRADISVADEVNALFDFAESTFGQPPHIVVACAGILDAKYSMIVDTDVADFDRVMAVNARGTFLCVREAAKRVTRGGGGRIVTFSSSLAAEFTPRFGAYTAAKAAVEALTKVVTKELKGTGITANCVAPGPIATDMSAYKGMEEIVKKIVEESPLRRLGKSEDIVSVVGFLVGDSGEWVNGQIIRVNGGKT